MEVLKRRREGGGDLIHVVGEIRAAGGLSVDGVGEAFALLLRSNHLLFKQGKQEFVGVLKRSDGQSSFAWFAGKRPCRWADARAVPTEETRVAPLSVLVEPDSRGKHERPCLHEASAYFWARRARASRSSGRSPSARSQMASSMA